MNFELDMDKILGYQKDFEKYEGLLPLLLMTCIRNEKYINNLKKKGIYYEDVQPKQWKRREKIRYLTDEEMIEFTDNELKKWLKENPKYEDIIIV